MVVITRRIMRRISYYYLEHAIRENGKITKKSRYLGRKIPKNIEEIKKQFTDELDREKWFDKFNKIKDDYATELANTPKTAIEKNLREFATRFTYNTQRIEGSTLRLRETAQLLEEGISPGGKPLGDIREAEAHEKLFFHILRQETDLSLQLILTWHKRLFEETKPDIAGQIRRHGVRIAGSKFIPPAPIELRPFLREFFNWYRSNRTKLHPVELAALVHLKFVTIQPFSDGNGRIGRLMMNFVLNKYGYPMLNIEYDRRRAYYNALERSQITKNGRTFCQWLFRKYLRAQSSQYAS